MTGSAELLKLAYSPDAVLNVTGISEIWNGATPDYDWSYDYDGLQRLTEATYPSIPSLVRMRVPSVMTMCLPWRATRNPAFSSARTAFW